MLKKIRSLINILVPLVIIPTASVVDTCCQATQSTHAEVSDTASVSNYHDIDRLCESGGIYQTDNLAVISGKLFSDWRSNSYLFEPLVRSIRGCPSERLCLDIVNTVMLGDKNTAPFEASFTQQLTLVVANGINCTSSSVADESPFLALTDSILASESNSTVKDLRLEIAVSLFASFPSGNHEAFVENLDRVSKMLPGNSNEFKVTRSVIEEIRQTPVRTLRGFDSLVDNVTDRFTLTNTWLVAGVFATEHQNEYAEFTQQLALDLDDIPSSFILPPPPAMPNDISLPGNFGLTLAHLAYIGGSSDNLKFLAERGADLDVAMELDLINVNKSNLRASRDPSFSPRRGDTLLLTAALDPFRKTDFLPILIKYTKNPNARDLLERNALHRFLYHRVDGKQKDLLKLLLDAKIDVNAQSVSGNTPCHVAANRNSHLIPQLVAAGADLSIKNHRGETPIDLLKQSIREKWIFHEENARILAQIESASSRK